MSKTIIVSDELHMHLKTYAARHKSTVKRIAESAIGNLISQKAASDSYSGTSRKTLTPQDFEKAKVSVRQGIDKSKDIPFE